MSPEFQSSLRELNSQKLPIRTALMLSAITDKLEAEIKRFEEAKLKSIRDAGVKDDKGELVPDEAGNIQLSPEEKVRVEAELADALSLEIDMPMIKMSELGASSALVSVADLFQLKGNVLLDDVTAQ
jgi:hypothetical protein